MADAAPGQTQHPQNRRARAWKNATESGRLYSERWDDQALVAAQVLAMDFKCGQEVDVFIPDDGDQVAVTFAAASDNLTQADDTDEKQICAYAATMIFTVFPGLKDIFYVALKDVSAIPKVISLPSGANCVNCIEVRDRSNIDKPTCLVLLGQVLLMLYKNVNELNFDRFISQRITALKAHANSSFSLSTLQLCDLKKAQTIRSMLGNNLELKRSVMVTMLAVSNQRNSLGAICAYVTNLLQWNEMAQMNFIMDVMVATKSPVLEDPRVGPEVVNLSVAFNLIVSATYPQYFRIFASSRNQKMIERNKFPIMITVATILKCEQYETLSQFVTPYTPTHPLVAELVLKHKNYLSGVEMKTHLYAVKALHNLLPQEEEEEEESFSA